MNKVKVIGGDGTEMITTEPVIISSATDAPTDPDPEVPMSDVIQFPYDDWGFKALNQRFWMPLNYNPWDKVGTYTSETGRVVSTWEPVSNVMAPMDGRGHFARHMRAIEKWKVGDVEGAIYELVVPCVKVTNVVDGSEKAPFYLCAQASTDQPVGGGWHLYAQSVRAHEEQYKRNPVYNMTSHGIWTNPASQNEEYFFDMKCQIPYPN